MALPRTSSVEFVDLMLTIEGGRPSAQSFSLLFDLVSDGSLVSGNSSGLDFLHVFFEMSKRVNFKTQVSLIRKLCDIVTNSLRARQFACSHGWIERLLFATQDTELVGMREGMVELATALASFSISPRELRRMFRILCSSHSGQRPALWQQLLEIFTRSMRRAGPQAYFELNGGQESKEPGIMFPVIKAWPMTSGYSVMAWVRVESFSEPIMRQGVYQPALYYFYSEQDAGIEAHLSKAGVLIGASNGKGRKQSVRIGFSFEERRWYHVCVTHEYRYIRSSEVSLFVDGQLIGSQALAFPKVEPPVTRGCIGNNIPPPNNERTQPLYGQLGRVLIFTESLAKEEVLQAYQLGPELRAAPRPGEVAADVGQAMGSFCFGGRRTVKLFAAFHAKAVDGNVVLDTASGQRDKHAQRLPGLRPVRTVSLRRSLRAVGGMPLFLPLFLQIDWPLEGGEHTEEPGSALAASSSAADLLRVLQLILHLTAPGDDALPLQPDMFAHLGLLLRRVSPSSLSVEVVRQLDKLAMQLLESAPHIHSLFTNCFLDFELWILAPYFTQLELFATLISHARRVPKQIRLLFPVQTMLDVLRDVYWFTPQLDSLGALPRHHPVSGAIVGQRPIATEIRALRALFLQLLYVYTNDEFTGDELRALCFHIRSCPDDEQLPDLLLYLLNRVAVSQTGNKRSAQLAEALHTAGGLPMWVALLWRKSADVKVLALKLLAAVLPYARLPARKSDKGPRDAAAAALAAIKAPLESGELTTSVYHALVELLLLSPSPQVERSQHQHPSASGTTPVFACAPVLPVLFELLAVRASFSVRLAALQDFAALLERSPQNLSVFTDQPHWQSWLLAFLARPSEPALAPSLQNAVVRVAAHAVHHLLLAPEGWKGINELHAMVAHFAEFFDTAPFLRSLCLAVFSELQRDTRLAAAGQKDIRVWENINAFLILTEAAFAPVDPQPLATLAQRLSIATIALPEDYFALGITRGEDGAWKEFASAQSILDLLDGLWLSAPAVLLRLPNVNETPPGSTSSVTAPLTPTPADLENSLFRLALRLTLYSLHETDTFYCSERFQLRKESLESVEELLMGEATGAVEDPEAEPRGVPLALSRYISGKMGEWTQELDSVQASFQRNLARLKRLLARATEHRNARTLVPTSSANLVNASPPSSSSAVNVTVTFGGSALDLANSAAATSLLTLSELAGKRIMLCVGFVFAAMRKSYENRGLGAEGMLALFKELTTHVRSVLSTSLANAAASLSADSFYELLITQLSFPDSAGGSQVNLLPAFAEAVKAVVDEEIAHHITARSQVQVQRQVVREGLQKSAQEDAEQAERFAVYAKQKQDADAAEESARRAAASAQRDRRRTRIEHKWVKVMRALAGERGPWHNLTLPDIRLDTPYWCLARVEDNLRRRLKLKKNYHGTSHAEAAKANKEPPKSGPVEDELLAKLSGLQAPVLAEGSLEGGLAALRPEAVIAAAEEEARSLFGIAAHFQKEDRLHALETDAEFVGPMSVTTGKLQLTKEWLVFVPVSAAEAPPEGPHNSHPITTQKKWSVSHLRAMYRRRYLLRSSALELFFVDTRSVFFNFVKKNRDTVARKIVQLSPSSLAEYPDTPNAITALLTAPSPENDFKRSNLLRRWQAREISNFEYLMGLNTLFQLAGRTYNDLTQYPVFPWIIADYTSAVLDLTKPSTFRDLTKPVGALNLDRLKQLRARYDAFDDPVIPKFLYGSHYSNPGIVLFWLVRVEPFTSHLLTLQGGKFDHPERTFFSIAQAWENCLRNPADVKELIPEFFYMPDFLRNFSAFDLGSFSDGTKIGDVILPPWAGGSPERFVALQREALESQYVSDNLHHWIDLIFGYKQRGDEANKANNVFFYLTYEGRCDLDKIEDLVQRAALESQIVNFGQTPSRLLNKPHPPRGPPPGSPAKRVVAGGQEPGSYALVAPRNVPVAHLSVSEGRILSANRDGTFLVSTLLQQPDGRGLPFSFEPDKAGKPRQLDFLIGDEVASAHACFAVLRDGKHVIHCGSWDDSFKLASITTGKPLITLTEHNDVVTCLTVDSTEMVLATGSADSTICVWDLPSIVKATSSGFVPAALTNTVTSLLVKEAVSPVKLMHEKQSNSTDTSAVAISPIYRLYGHDDTVSCLHANTNLDVLLSGSTDGSVIVWNLRRGSFLRSLPIGQPVEQVALSLHSLIVVASKLIKPRQLVKRQAPSRSKSSEVLPTAPVSPVAPPAAAANLAPPSAAPVSKLKASAHQRRHSGHAAPPPKPEEEYYLTLWTINGVKTAERQVSHQVTSILVTADGKFALAGTIGGAVLVLNLGPLWQPLQLLHTYTIDEKPPYNAVKSMAFACSEHYLLVGVESGSVLLLPLHPSDWVPK